MHNVITRSEANDMSHAHAEGLHADHAREGCPDCDGRDLSSYPPFAPGQRVNVSDGNYVATVVRCERDRRGWDVLVLPESIIDGKSDPRWVGSAVTPVV
jgi:hypothetical protein